ncbi:NAD-dependent epimerase/dehydratase family protein [Brevundimonas phoenicis]|uniref:NAD-dependent epimerase/dehydratase family protein n=1 Tax=unclassified Brevundimonas TaxID=2622653 RepID=UPI0039A048F3
MKTCLVTGGAGFIGCAMSKALASNFERVIAFDNLHPQVHANRVRPAALDERVELIQGDVCDPEAWRALLDQRIEIDTVIHLAAETGTGQSLTEASRHAEVNVVGTARMLDAFASAGITPRRIVLSSSRAVYGEGAWAAGDGEVLYPGQRSDAQLSAGQWDFLGARPLPSDAATTMPSPTSVYGATKLTQEQILSSWAYSFGVELVFLRLQNVYGPGQSLTNAYTGIVPLFIRWAKEGKSIPLYEDGEIGRDFVYIADVADALVRAATLALPPRLVYDVGTGRVTTIRDLATTIARIYGAPEPHVSGQYRNGDVRNVTCVISSTEAALDWSPQWSLDAGLRSLCAWVDSQLPTE